MVGVRGRVRVRVRGSVRVGGHPTLDRGAAEDSKNFLSS